MHLNTTTRHFLVFAAIFLFAIPMASGQFYYGLQQSFGKNRVQYNDFFWSYYRFDAYDVYYYRNSRAVAQFVAEEANHQLKELTGYLDFPLDDRLEFLVYNTMLDLRQSNVQLITEAEYNTGGLSKIVGSKVFLHFTGDYRELRAQIRAGITQVILNQMMYGGDLRDVIRSSTFVNLPHWYTAGLVSYLSDPDNVDMQNRIRDGVISGRFEKFKVLNTNEQVAAGHAIWQYISYRYGQDVIPQILYMTRINNNLESGFNFILGTNLTRLSNDFLTYYQGIYIQDKLQLPAGEELKLGLTPDIFLSKFVLNPDRDQAAYATNELGKIKVFLLDLNTGKKTKLFKGGYPIAQNVDYNYPLLTWHPTGRILTMIYEDKGFVRLKIYDLERDEVQNRPLFFVEQITSMEYSADGRTLLVSAVREGQSDIYEYSVLSNTFKQITNDVYGDFNPTYMAGERFIAFTSTRPDDTLRGRGGDSLNPQEKTDLFIYRKDLSNAPLWQLTNTPDVNELQPDRFSTDALIFLRDQDLRRNRYVMALDSAVAYVDTVTHYRYLSREFQQSQYRYNILGHDYDAAYNHLAEWFFYDGSYHVHLRDLPGLERMEELGVNPEPKPEEVEVAEVSPSTSNDTLVFKVPEKDNSAKDFDLDNYVFHPDLVDGPEPEPEPEETEEEEDEEDDPDPFVLPKPRNYVRAFYTDYFVSQLDNSFMNESYQPFTGGGPLFLNPSFNSLIKIGLGDLFEDYKIIGGIRLSTSLTNAEYFLAFKNFKRRYDHTYTFNRKSMSTVINNQFVVKIITNQVQYQVSYPFSEVAALSGTFGARYDHGIIQSTDNNSLNAPDTYQTWLNGRLTYTFDNTIPKGLNLYNGTRYKLFYEHYQNPDGFDAGMHIMGADFRHYQKLHRSLIWANRFAASTSFGSRRLVYFMGGVDSWLAPKYNFDTPIDLSQNYAFQTLATNMRGFHQNIRNGNSFAVLNSEVRWPIFKYFFNRPMKSDFIANFQFIGFGDVGTAWTGPHPYSPENALNNTVITNGPFTINLDEQREPIVYGYGFGVRSKVLGYFVRADWAWGVEDGITLDRVFYLSLSQDF